MLISDIYKIPITLIAPRTYRENGKEYLSMNITKGTTYIIRTTGVNKYKKTLPKYKMIINKSKEGMLEIRNLPETSIQSEIMNQRNSIPDLLKTYDSNDSNDRNDSNDSNDSNDKDNIDNNIITNVENKQDSINTIQDENKETPKRTRKSLKLGNKLKLI